MCSETSIGYFGSPTTHPVGAEAINGQRRTTSYPAKLASVALGQRSDILPVAMAGPQIEGLNYKGDLIQLKNENTEIQEHNVEELGRSTKRTKYEPTKSAVDTSNRSSSTTHPSILQPDSLSDLSPPFSSYLSSPFATSASRYHRGALSDQPEQQSTLAYPYHPIQPSQHHQPPTVLNLRAESLLAREMRTARHLALCEQLRKEQALRNRNFVLGRFPRVLEYTILKQFADNSQSMLANLDRRSRFQALHDTTAKSSQLESMAQSSNPRLLDAIYGSSSCHSTNHHSIQIPGAVQIQQQMINTSHVASLWQELREVEHTKFTMASSMAANMPSSHQASLASRPLFNTARDSHARSPPRTMQQDVASNIMSPLTTAGLSTSGEAITANVGVPSDCLSMALASDEGKLSKYQIMIQQQLEFFTATQKEVEFKTQGRKKPVQLGQVGIQCRHCARLPLARRGRGSVYFPSRLDGIYQAAQNMASTHLIESCDLISVEVRQEIRCLRERHEIASGGKAYWAEACHRMGIYESENGLQLSAS